MKSILLLALLAAAPLALRAQPTPANPWTDHRRALPDKLRQVPVGLSLWHTPNPVYPAPNPAQPGGYVWQHATLIRSDVNEPLTVVECGSFIWYSAAGWQVNLHQTPAEFAHLFHCPGGRLLPGVTYTFAQNNRYADNARQLYGGDALWYILARDPAGKLYKGFGLIETEATVR